MRSSMRCRGRPSQFALTARRSRAQPPVPWARLLCSLARAGSAWVAVSASPAWWARMAARSPWPKRPAVAAWPSARSTAAAVVERGQVDRLGHLDPDPRAARGGGLGQPQPRARHREPGTVPRQQFSRRGVRPSGPSARGGKCASATRGVPGVVRCVAGDLDRTGVADMHDHHLLRVGPHPHRLPAQGVRHRIRAVLERDHRRVRRHRAGHPERRRCRGARAAGAAGRVPRPASPPGRAGSPGARGC